MLIWKEWRERKWQLALGTAWMLCGTVYVVWYEMAHRRRDPVASMYAVATMYGIMAAVLLAIRTAVGEKTKRTIDFSAAIPVSHRRVAWIRLGGAVVTLAIPMLLGAAALSVVLGTGFVEQALPRPHVPAPPRLPDRASLAAIDAIGFLLRATAVEIAAAVTLLILIVILGARLRGESHVGFLGAFLGIMSLAILPGIRAMFVMMGNPALGDWCGALEPQALAVNFGYRDLQGSYGDLDLAGSVWGPLLANLLILFVLGDRFARRYGRLGMMSVSRRWAWGFWRPPGLLSRLPLRWPGRLPALIWLDLRQAIPLALSGLGVACLLTIFGLLTESGGEGTLMQQFAGQLPGSSWAIAELWAVIVAAGVFSSELQPDLGTFWRSRPIGPATWYLVKFVVGLVAVLGVLDGVTIWVSWNSPFGSGPNQMSWSYVACMPLLHATIYAITVLGVCWLRRPVVGALAGLIAHTLAITLLGAFPNAGQFEPITVYNGLFQAEKTGQTINLWNHNYPIVYGTLATMAIAAAILAVPAILKPDSALPLFARRERQLP